MRPDEADAPLCGSGLPRKMSPILEVAKSGHMAALKGIAMESVFIERFDHSVFNTGISSAITHESSPLECTFLLLPGNAAEEMRLIGGGVGADAREPSGEVEEIGLNEGGKSMADEQPLCELRVVVTDYDLPLLMGEVFFHKDGGVVERQIAIGRKGFSHILIGSKPHAPELLRLHPIAQDVAPRQTKKAMFEGGSGGWLARETGRKW